MSSPRSAYQGSVRVLSALFVAIGVAILVVTLVNGGGIASTGVLLGVAFAGIGAGRLWVSFRMSQ